MSDLLQQIGLTKEEIQERVIDRAVESLLESALFDDEGKKTGSTPSSFQREIDKRIAEKINETISKLFEAHVAPNVTQMVTDLTLQETNSWGEKMGKPVTFVEYLVRRADAYIREEVDHSGKSKAESNDRSYWSKSTTRIAFMIHQHLQYNIETAMKQALSNANSSIAGGILSAVQIKLQELLTGLTVSVGVKK